MCWVNNLFSGPNLRLTPTCRRRRHLWPLRLVCDQGQRRQGHCPPHQKWAAAARHKHYKVTGWDSNVNSLTDDQTAWRKYTKPKSAAHAKTSTACLDVYFTSIKLLNILFTLCCCSIGVSHLGLLRAADRSCVCIDTPTTAAEEFLRLQKQDGKLNSQEKKNQVDVENSIC